MKYTIFMLIVIASLISCGKPPGDVQDLTELLGKDVQSPDVKKFLLTFKNDRDSGGFDDVRLYRSKGIEMHFENDKVLQQIKLQQVFLYSGIDGKYGKYMGKLPYNLSFDDTPAIVHKKLGDEYESFRDAEYGFNERYKTGQFKIYIIYDSDPKANDATIERISIHPRD